MEIVRSACPIYRSTIIPPLALHCFPQWSSIQVNDRGGLAFRGAGWVSLMRSARRPPAKRLSRSDFVLWPVADATAGDRGVRLPRYCGRDAYLWLQEQFSSMT